MPRPGLLLFLLLVACGDARGRVVLAPGADLAAADAWRWLERPDTGLPPDVLSAAGLATEVALEAQDWSFGRPPPPSLLEQFDLPADVVVQRALPRVSLRGGSVVLHDGVELARWRPAGTVAAWRDADGARVFWWSDPDAALYTAGSSPLGQVLVRDPATEQEAQAPGTPSVSECVQPFVAGGVRRRGLLVPAPSSLELDVEGGGGAALELVVAVAEMLHARDPDGRILQVRRGDPLLRFVVQLESGSGLATLWEQGVRASQGFVRAVVPLPGLEGSGRLILRTETTRPADGYFAHAHWSGLTVLGPRRARDERPHVVIVDVDTLRADAVGACGGPARNTPRLDAWAARSAVVHEDALAASNWTLPSTLSMLTGLAVHQHGVLAIPSTLPAGARTLAEMLDEAGYATGAVVEGGYLVADAGFGRGFDLYVTQPMQQPDWSVALDWMRTRAGVRPVFLFLQTYLVHAPWRVDERFEDPAAPYTGPLRGRAVTHDDVLDPFARGELELDAADHAYLRRQYDAAVRRMDDDVGAFLEELEGFVQPSRCLVVFTSDHGEELFDHGRIGHGNSLYRELLAVPLVVADPREAPGRSAAPASGLDLVPTVLEAVGLGVPEGLPGRPLRMLATAPRLRSAQHADSAHAADYDGWTLVRGLIAERGQQADPLQLFDRRRDQRELADLADAEPARVERLARLLDDWLAAHPPLAGAVGDTGAMSSELRADLEALGYLGR